MRGPETLAMLLGTNFTWAHSTWVEDVRFRVRVRGEKVRAGRPVLVISTFGLSEAERADLRRRYLAAFAADYLSFPVKERADHLMVRFGEKVYDFDYPWIPLFPKFSGRELKLPSDHTLEVMVRLDASEVERLATYVRNIEQRRSRTIGKFRLAGNQLTKGTPADNRTMRGGHNCTTWISTAPVGGDGHSLMEVLGGDRSIEIGTNPGWWLSWLAATATQVRVPFCLLWTPEPLSEAVAKIEPGKNLEWDFNKH